MHWLLNVSKRSQIFRAQYIDFGRFLKSKGVPLKAKRPKRLQPEVVYRSVMIRLDHLLRSARRLRGAERENDRTEVLRNLRCRLLSQCATPRAVRLRGKPLSRA